MYFGYKKVFPNPWQRNSFSKQLSVHQNTAYFIDLSSKTNFDILSKLLGIPNNLSVRAENADCRLKTNEMRSKKTQ